MDRSEFIKILPSYLGCEARLDTGEIGKLSYVNDCNDAWIYTQDSKICESIGDFKLLLRRVEDMTQNEYDVLGEILGYDHFETAEFVSERELCEQFHNYKTTSKATRYLNSIGVDTDGLLGTEWAEHKTTTEQ